MILKHADDKTVQIERLTQLAADKSLPEHTRQHIQRDLYALKRGVAGEKAAAYELDFHFKDLLAFVIHDLRLEVGGRVAQIDHLVMNATCDFYVLETKNFSQGLSIDDRGDFTAWYSGKPVGIASPMAQNARHIAVLSDALKVAHPPTKLGIPAKPNFHSCILLGNEARLTAPNKGYETVMKLDRFIGYYLERYSTTSMVKRLPTLALQLTNHDEFKAWIGRLLAMHKPADFDPYTKYKIGAKTEIEPAREAKAAGKVAALHVPQPETGGNPASKFVCDGCTRPIPYVVAKFCWTNKRRFHGKTYCRECQTSH